jgi:endonuclease G
MDEQVGNELYKSNDLDRGHLVRRIDPAWGDSLEVAKTANDDTFHYTNCAPQHFRFNRNTEKWLGLENYILHHADNHDLKVSVFSGPVFRNSDRVHRGIRIPRDFWKVAAIVKGDGSLSATGYLLTQADLIDDLPAERVRFTEEDFIFGDYNMFQVPIWKLQEITGLSFRQLSSHDPLNDVPGFESTRTSDMRMLRDMEDIAL